MRFAVKQLNIQQRIDTYVDEGNKSAEQNTEIQIIITFDEQERSEERLRYEINNIEYHQRKINRNLDTVGIGIEAVNDGLMKEQKEKNRKYLSCTGMDATKTNEIFDIPTNEADLDSDGGKENKSELDSRRTEVNTGERKYAVGVPKNTDDVISNDNNKDPTSMMGIQSASAQLELQCDYTIKYLKMCEESETKYHDQQSSSDLSYGSALEQVKDSNYYLILDNSSTCDIFYPTIQSTIETWYLLPIFLWIKTQVSDSASQ